MFIDQYDDTENKILKKYADDGIILSKREDVHELPDKDFAVIIKRKRKHRKFPICDRMSTLVSLLYLLHGLNDLPEDIVNVAAPRIKEAAVKYDVDIPAKLEKYPIGNDDYIVTEIEPKTKEARVDDSVFGLVYEENGEKVRKFPMPDEHHTKIAAQKFEEVKDELDKEKRAQLEEAIQEKMVEFDMVKEATLNPNLKRDMEFKIRHLTKEAQAPYMRLVDKLKEDEVTIKEAEVLVKKLDNRNNLDTRKFNTDDLLTDKEKTSSVTKHDSVIDFFPKKEKRATAQDKIDMILTIKDDDKLRKRFMERMKKKFSDGLVDDLCQDPETIYKSLPEPHQNIIDRTINEVLN